MSTYRNHRKFAASDAVFIRSCKIAGIPATQRQASKYRMHKGKAWPLRRQAVAELAEEAKQQ